MVYPFGSRLSISQETDTETKIYIYHFHREWFQRQITMRDLGSELLNSGGHGITIPEQYSRFKTLPLPTPEQVITSKNFGIQQIWMDENFLATNSVRAIRIW